MAAADEEFEAAAAKLTPERIASAFKKDPSYRMLGTPEAYRTAWPMKHVNAAMPPYLSLAVVADGQPVWSRGYDLADLENHSPAKASTSFRSASIGKTMTATTAMQLVEQGKLDLETEISRYCPAFPNPRRITVRHLLSHLSGLGHYEGPREPDIPFETLDDLKKQGFLDGYEKTVLVIDNERKIIASHQRQATRKSGLHARRTGQKYLGMQSFAGSSSVKSRPACSCGTLGVIPKEFDDNSLQL